MTREQAIALAQARLRLQGPSVGEDMLKTAPSAAVRAITGVSGAAGDIDAAARSAASWLLGNMGLEGAAANLQSAPSILPTSQQEQSVIESAIGPLYQPQTLPGH